jgi:hypothetical protein
MYPPITFIRPIASRNGSLATWRQSMTMTLQSSSAGRTIKVKRFNPWEGMKGKTDMERVVAILQQSIITLAISLGGIYRLLELIEIPRH